MHVRYYFLIPNGKCGHGHDGNTSPKDPARFLNWVWWLLAATVVIIIIVLRIGTGIANLGSMFHSIYNNYIA